MYDPKVNLSKCMSRESSAYKINGIRDYYKEGDDPRKLSFGLTHVNKGLKKSLPRFQTSGRAMHWPCAQVTTG
ncbi:hypothetical protein OS493_009660 [Desmophyllum pertusum]|uniref:Uncharacterized protein n=1 Tax=Desmophyllum pertusum TaxID=174260 RepID=A0A9X0CLN8_9CNID|nr:hypothetical protein OS493_009660 [Desmophyllum pertusum]